MLMYFKLWASNKCLDASSVLVIYFSKKAKNKYMAWCQAHINHELSRPKTKNATDEIWAQLGELL